MQSSFNVIKNENAKALGEKEIIVDYVPKKNISINSDNNAENESYNRLATSIVETARSKSDEIIRNAYEEVAKVQMKAEEQGYKNGYDNGYAKGYEEGYRKALEEAYDEASAIREDASNIIRDAKKQYEMYLEEKTENVKELMSEIVSNVLKKEMESEDTIINLIKETIRESRNAETFIIKCNSIHEKELKDKVDLWKLSLGVKGEIFIVADDFLENAQIIIEKDNGKVEIHIEDSMEKIKDIILNS